MVGQGNAKVDRCISNLLRIRRGEVPYDRIRGLDMSIIDRPVSLAKAALQADAAWVLSFYEPRAELENVTVQTQIKRVAELLLHVSAKGV